jgi:hypothetical protein
MCCKHEGSWNDEKRRKFSLGSIVRNTNSCHVTVLACCKTYASRYVALGVFAAAKNMKLFLSVERQRKIY